MGSMRYPPAVEFQEGPFEVPVSKLDGKCHTRRLQLNWVPLAHPQKITATSSYEEPCVAITFATSRPGEPLADFRHRLSVRDHYSRTKGVELILDREAATELVRLLLPVVGRTEIGLLIDSP